MHDDVGVRASKLFDQYREPQQRRELEDSLADKAGLLAGSVLVHIPKPGALAKLAGVRVMTDDDEVMTLELWDKRHSGRFVALNLAHERLWRIAVYADPDVMAHEPDSVAMLQAAAQDVFGPPSRYGAGRTPPGYLAALFDRHAAANGWTVEDRKSLAGISALGPDTTREAALATLTGYIAMRRAGLDEQEAGPDLHPIN